MTIDTARQRGRVSSNQLISKKCTRCGCTYTVQMRLSKIAKYCKDCGILVRREQRAERKRLRRATERAQNYQDHYMLMTKTESWGYCNSVFNANELRFMLEYRVIEIGLILKRGDHLYKVVDAGKNLALQRIR